MAKQKLTPYQRIIVAANAGRGVRLSPEECAQMSLDDAIATVAMNDWHEQGEDADWSRTPDQGRAGEGR